MLTQFKEYFPKYLPKLIEMLANNELKIAVDLGLNSVNGEFKGIDSVVRAVEVNIKKKPRLIFSLISQ